MRNRISAALFLLVALALALWSCGADAQVQEFNPCTQIPAGVNANNPVAGCNPVTTANPLPVTGAVSQASPAVGSGTSGFPPGSTPQANAATGSTGAVTATLPAVASQFTYLCNLQVSAAGGTATISPITVAGVQGGSLVFQGISAGGAPFIPPAWTPCLRSSAVNTPITVTTTADGTATAVDVQASGFSQ